jgi:NADH-quinone oxidoreductase subunit D
MGAYGLDLGSFTPFLYAFRERERILDLFEEACGARLTYSYLTPGGATADLPPGWTDRCLAFLDSFEPNIADYHTLLTTNAVFVRRTAGIGVMPAEMAIDYGTSGPVLRGSGVDWDLRRDGDEWYTRMYDGYDFRVVCSRDGEYDLPPGAPRPPREAVLGDCWHRFFVRMLEVIESISLVRQAIDRYRATDFDEPRDHGVPIKLAQKLPVGEAYLETECPRGQMGFYVVSAGEAIPWRARARSGSFCNLSIMRELSAGCLIADIPAIVGSLDIVMGEIDR